MLSDMKSLPEPELKNLIRDILNNGDLVPSRHARERMQLRKYSLADVRHILKNGALLQSELNEEQFRYTLRGEDLEGDPGEVVITIQGSRIVIITVKGGV